MTETSKIPTTPNHALPMYSCKLLRYRQLIRIRTFGESRKSSRPFFRIGAIITIFEIVTKSYAASSSDFLSELGPIRAHTLARPETPGPGVSGGMRWRVLGHQDWLGFPAATQYPLRTVNSTFRMNLSCGVNHCEVSVAISPFTRGCSQCFDLAT